MSAPASSPGSIAALRRQIAPLTDPLPGPGAVLPFGDARIDRHLPGGLPIGQLHAIAAAAATPQAAAAASAFTALLAGRLMVQDGLQHQGRVTLWIAPSRDLYAPGLLPYGLDPARLILVHARTDAETLQSAETALRSGAAAVVVSEAGPLGHTAARRLQLAGQPSQTTALLLHRRPVRPAPCATRWQVGPATALPARPGASPGAAIDDVFPAIRWRLTLQQARGGRPGQWEMEVGDAPGSLHVVAVLGDDAAASGAAAQRRAAG